MVTDCCNSGWWLIINSSENRWFNVNNSSMAKYWYRPGISANFKAKYIGIGSVTKKWYIGTSLTNDCIYVFVS